MEISRHTWHYKLIRSLQRYPERNLCPYCRQIIYALATWTGMIIAGTALAIAVSVILSYPLWQIFWGTSESIAIVSTLAYIFIAAAAFTVYRESDAFCYQRSFWHKDLLGPLKSAMPRRTTPKPPGFVRTYIRATHDKVCPRLNFKE